MVANSVDSVVELVNPVVVANSVALLLFFKWAKNSPDRLPGVDRFPGGPL